MQSKTSFFNGTLYKKNLTRFAPVWVFYSLCLILGITMTYTDNDAERRLFWFAAHMADDITKVLILVNLCYALIVAQLLFGDLYNSRMCNAIHAFPIRREGWFLSNLCSGLTFSLLPTAIMALVSLPLMANSLFAGAWKIPLLTFAAANLQFICFFGIAVLCTMCVGNRFTMIAAYGLLNFGAYMAHATVEILYRPLMYGFITPYEPFVNLTPVVKMMESQFYTLTDYFELENAAYLQKVPLSSLTASFTLEEGWGSLAIWAGVGVALMAAALVLYKKRHLECAGDAVAFKCLVPVFQVLCSLFVMVAAYFLTRNFFGLNISGAMQYLYLALGLAVGWFVAKMLIDRSTRVFRLRNLPGLAALILAVALTFVGTHFDVLGIQRRIPDLEDIQSVALGGSGTDFVLKDEAGIQDALRIHALALENPNDGTDLYIKGYDGNYHRYTDTNDHLYDKTQEQPDYTYVTMVRLNYELKNGKTLSRRYYIWVDNEEGQLLRKYASSWEALAQDDYSEESGSRLAYVMSKFRYMRVGGNYGEQEAMVNDVNQVRSFLDAVRADCEAGNMAQNSHFHRGAFRTLFPVAEEYEDAEPYPLTEALSISIRGEDRGWYLAVYPDAENTVRWLQEHDLLNYEVIPDIYAYWTPETDE